MGYSRTNNKAEIESLLCQFHGTQYYHSNLGGRCLYTDGIKAMAELCGAFWLLDAVESHQYNPEVGSVYFQIWNLKKTETGVWVLSMRTDDDQPFIVFQEISYSDFPLNEFEFYTIHQIMLLKNEY